MKKLLSFITGLCFVISALFAYSNICFIYSFYFKGFSDPEVASRVNSILMLAILIATIGLATKISNKILWIMTGILAVVPFSILFIIMEPAPQSDISEDESKLMEEVLDQLGVNLEEDAAMISNLMEEGKEQATAEFSKGMEFYEARDARNSVYWLTKSAKHLSKPAYRKLIDMYSTGDLVEKDLITAGAFANMFTMLISTQEESDYVQNIHSMAMATRIEGGPNPHFEIKRKRNEIWDNDEWAGNDPE